MQVTFSSEGQTGDLRVGQKSLTYQFQRFLYQTLYVFSQIKIENKLNRIFILLLGSCLGMGMGESKTIAWGFAMVPHRLSALVWF